MDKIFLDTETTGLAANKGDRVVEIAALKYRGRVRIPAGEGGEYHTYINPERDVPAEAFNVHGLSGKFLADKPLFADIADAFIAFVQGGEVIIHNAEFDEGFLDAELQAAGKPRLKDIAAQVSCSLVWARQNLPNLSGYSLDVLCRHFEVNLAARKEFHNALVDTGLLAEVYFRMRQQQAEMQMDSGGIIQISAQGSSIVARAASADELAQHEALLQEMQQATGAAPIYKQPPPAAAASPAAAGDTAAE